MGATLAKSPTKANALCRTSVDTSWPAQQRLLRLRCPRQPLSRFQRVCGKTTSQVASAQGDSSRRGRRVQLVRRFSNIELMSFKYTTSGHTHNRPRLGGTVGPTCVQAPLRAVESRVCSKVVRTTLRSHVSCTSDRRLSLLSHMDSTANPCCRKHWSK